MKFISLLVFIIITGSASAHDNSCNDLLLPVMTKSDLIEQFQSKGAALHREFLDAGSEGSLFGAVELVDGQLAVFVEKSFRSEELARQNLEALGQLRTLEAGRLLTGFRTVRVLGWNAHVVRMELIEGRDVMAIAEWHPVHGRQILAAYMRQLRAVYRKLKRAGYQVLLQEDNRGRPIDLYISQAGKPKVTILWQNVIYDIPNREFVIVDPF